MQVRATFQTALIPTLETCEAFIHYRHRRRQVLSRPSQRKCGRRRVRGHGDRGEEDEETEEGREGHDL